VRRSDERIVAPVDVESESLRALSKNMFVAFHLKPLVIQVDEVGLESLHMLGAKPGAAVLVAVRRSIATAGRADLATLLFVLILVRIGYDMRVLRNEDLPFRAHATLFEHGYLAEELIRIEYAAGADNGFDAKKNARRNMVGDEFLPFVEDRVPGVASAVVAEHVGVGVFICQIVGNFALATISILEINYDIQSQHSCRSLADHGPRRKCRNLEKYSNYKKRCLQEIVHNLERITDAIAYLEVQVRTS